MKDERLDLEVLVAAARDVAKKAYAPYSRFRVGAAVVTEQAAVYTGCNVENAAYGSTVCAEVSAITSAISAGEAHLEAIAVAALDGVDVFPCGNCRQVMREFGVDKLIVDGTDGPTVYTLDDVFPHSFGPEDLGGD